MKTPDPTSEEIEELFAFLPQLHAKGFSPVRKWHGGDKDEDGVITMPFPEYQPIVEEFFRIASNECWTDGDYLSESKRELTKDEDAVKTADLDEIKTMLTFCVRGEKFCTGHWEAMIENGYIRSLLERLAELGSKLA